MAKNTGNEFFELFRRAPDREARVTRASEATAPRRDVAEEPPKETVFKERAPETEGRKPSALSLEGIVLSVFAVVVLLVASHVWGYYRGRASVREPEVATGARGPARVPRRTARRTSAADRAAKSNKPASQQPLAVPKTGGDQERFVTLQIMGGISLDGARRVVADLKREGRQDVFIYQPRRSRGYTVNVGRFSSTRDPRLAELKYEFAAKLYGGREAFKDCLEFTISDPGRIKR